MLECPHSLSLKGESDVDADTDQGHAAVSMELKNCVAQQLMKNKLIWRRMKKVLPAQSPAIIPTPQTQPLARQSCWPEVMLLTHKSQG